MNGGQGVAGSRQLAAARGDPYPRRVGHSSAVVRGGQAADLGPVAVGVGSGDVAGQVGEDLVQGRASEVDAVRDQVQHVHPVGTARWIS